MFPYTHMDKKRFFADKILDNTEVFEILMMLLNLVKSTVQRTVLFRGLSKILM